MNIVVLILKNFLETTRSSEGRVPSNICIYIYDQDAWFAVGWKAKFLQVRQGTLVSLNVAFPP